jgi:hypothetical protein
VSVSVTEAKAASDAYSRAQAAVLQVAQAAGAEILERPI